MSHEGLRGDTREQQVDDSSKNYVFLDYGELIMHYEFNRETTLQKAHKLALKYINRTSERKVTFEQLDRAHNIEIQTYLLSRRDGHKETSLLEMVKSILWELDLGEEVSRDEVTGIYERNDHIASPMPTTLESIPELRSLANLGIITNLPHSSYNLELRRYRLEGVFNPIVASWQAGFRKPHSTIYQMALNRASICPQEATFFSHDQEEVDGALAVGMQARLAKNLGEVLTKLKASYHV